MINLFYKLLSTIEDVQKKFKHEAGVEKKALVIDIMTKWNYSVIKLVSQELYENNLLFIEFYLHDVIDLLIMVVKNKKLIKIFKRSMLFCNCSSKKNNKR